MLIRGKLAPSEGFAMRCWGSHGARCGSLNPHTRRQHKPWHRNTHHMAAAAYARCQSSTMRMTSVSALSFRSWKAELTNVVCQHVERSGSSRTYVSTENCLANPRSGTSWISTVRHIAGDATRSRNRSPPVKLASVSVPAIALQCFERRGKVTLSSIT